MAHLLVTNDFPPKHGGIQSYLYELWRRLPPGMATVYTTSYPGAAAFDSAQEFRVVRSHRTVLLPTTGLVSSIDRLASETGSGLVVLDPALPLGLVGARLARPYGVVVHGAEITVPGRLPGTRELLDHVLSSATWIVAAGGYSATEARRATSSRLPPVTEVPPGVDVDRFRPLSDEERRAARRRLGLPVDALIVVSISRLVPRKGMDVLIRAVARLRRCRPDLVLAIGGSGRDERRLRAVASVAGVPVHWLGQVRDENLPLAYGAADVYAMCCRDRWLGLEQEGFGIVFLEAAACGIPQVAGASGGSAEAVVDGETGVVVGDPGNERAVAAALEPLLDDPSLRQRLGEAARDRAVAHFAYDKLALRLERALLEAGG
ncbi:MAG: glycosyltransferase family 4 protein [Acidimicrobiales bacterium]